MKPHRKAAPAEAAAAGRQEMPRCAPKADSGLSSAQAQALAEAGWDNRPVESPTKSDKQIHPGKLSSPTSTWIFVASGGCACCW